MTIGLIARADGGGLASQTYEIWRNIRPERTLVVDLGVHERGPTDTTRYDAPWSDTTVIRPTHPQHWGTVADLWVAGCDTILSCETYYDDRLYAVARAAGTRTVLQLNPELFTAADSAADALWAPTVWSLDRLPATTVVVPVGVAHDRLPYRRRESARTFFHTTGDAMLDRNGTRTIIDALHYVQQPCRLLLRGRWDGPTTWTDGHVTVEHLPPVADYTDVIPDDTDVMLLPRRYGGLCLPVQEAAARGIPTVMTDLSPQSGWLPRTMTVGTSIGTFAVPMKGGRFDVYDSAPRAWAGVIDRLVQSPGEVAAASDAMYAWSRTLSWDVWTPQYRTMLTGPLPSGRPSVYATT